MKRHKETTCIVKGQSYFPSELNFAGFVLSDAQGHPMNGDTAVTLFVGGMITIRNGRFQIYAEQVTFSISLYVSIYLFYSIQ